MLLCELGHIVHVAKLSNSRISCLYFQKLWFKSTKMFYARSQTNNDVIRFVSLTNQRTFMDRCYSLRRCHSFVQEEVKTADAERKAQRTSQDEQQKQVSEEKVKIYFETTKRGRIECLAFTNQNVMNASIENDIAMHGNCNGEAICSVCHVYIDQKYQEFMPKISDEEAEMLDMVPNLQENSRLSCQIVVKKELEGAVFKLPPYEGPSYDNPNC